MLNKSIPIQSILTELSRKHSIQLDVLRLDCLHPTLSGNKWFKLKYNLEEAKLLGSAVIVSFGGAFSNHLHALAFAGFKHNIKTIGVVRGEPVMNDTLSDCKKWGMDVEFVSRTEYKLKNTESYIDELQKKYSNAYILPEGGNNELGRRGCMHILQNQLVQHYDYVTCAVGTGTTLSGIIEFLKGESHVLGFVALKNGYYLENEIKQSTSFSNYQLLHNYHYGGFGKINETITCYIKQFFTHHQIMLDAVYTAKMFLGLEQEIKLGRFENGSKILAIHTGGVQGNRGFDSLVNSQSV